MDTYYPNNEPASSDDVETIASELHAWFSVPGDMDDFIYFGEPSDQQSER